MPVLVTGGTGFLGRNLVDRLLTDGRRVRVLTRDASRAPRTWSGRVEMELGDLRDSGSVRRAVADVSVIYHLAGEVHDSTLFEAVNIGGVQAIFEEAERSGVVKVVHLSSAGVTGASGHGTVTESTPCHPSNDYERTKYRGEQVVSAFVSRGKIKAVVLRPTIVFGEEKNGKDSLLEWLSAIQAGRFAFVGRRGIANYVYVQDVIDACVKAAEANSSPFETYIVGDSTAVQEFVHAAAAALDTRPPQATVPVWLAYGIAAGMETGRRLFGTPAPLTISRVRTLSSNVMFSAEKLHGHLGWVPRVGFRQGLRRTVAWYRQCGKL
jgi:dihydroflavonol-4-reductase